MQERVCVSIGSQWGHLVSFVLGKDTTTALGVFCLICKNKPLKKGSMCTRTVQCMGGGKEQSAFECVCICGWKDGGLAGGGSVQLQVIDEGTADGLHVRVLILLMNLCRDASFSHSVYMNLTAACPHLLVWSFFFFYHHCQAKLEAFIHLHRICARDIYSHKAIAKMGKINMSSHWWYILN